MNNKPKSSNQEKIQAALDRIDSAVENINTDADWLAFLSFSSKFHSYSARNILLIYAQKPEATFVKGFKAWHELGRYVKKGAKGIAILAPCTKTVEVFNEPENKSEYQDKKGEKVKKQIITGFKIAHVFDISDTDGSDENLPILVKGLSGDGEQEQKLYEHLRAFISAEHQVQEVADTAAKGTYNFETGVISVRSDLEPLQKVKTILHEYAHSIDFTINPSEDISRSHRELVAESVAYVVSLRLGLDTSRYSMSYIKSWLTDKDKLKAVADTVQKISMEIINKLAGSGDTTFAMLKDN